MYDCVCIVVNSLQQTQNITIVYLHIRSKIRTKYIVSDNTISLLDLIFILSFQYSRANQSYQLISIMNI